MHESRGSLAALWFAVTLAFAVATFAGWRLFWFLTDDSFISFRYMSNWVNGRGLVWNPAPFAPVEGYTSFLWVAVLSGVWGVFGIEPPDAANWISLGFGYATLAVCVQMLRKMALPESMQSHRLALAVLAMVGIVSNRTFLTWLSSGLETSMFNFLVTAWVALALTASGTFTSRKVALLCTVTALTALTRPDGLLFAAATVCLVIVVALEQQPAQIRWWSVAPLALVGVHLSWRLAFYGAWLPNTYYAKHAGGWPEAGIRYLGSFVVEYGLWVFMLLCLSAFPLMWRTRLWSWLNVRRALVVGAALGHVGYYTVVIGGDHFEYRVFSHLIPLIWCATIWIAARRFSRPIALHGFLVVQLVASWPVQWIHWEETRHLNGRRKTLKMVRPVAPRFPGWLQPVMEEWDGWQKWLIKHSVGTRHQEHKVFWQHQVKTLPSRAVGSEISWDERGVMVRKCVGVIGWVFPNVAVIDRLGLNDRVVARTPVRKGKVRQMAHDRLPPKGYTRCFQPNFEYKLKRKQAKLKDRPKPLTDEAIRDCERRHWLLPPA